MTITQSSRMSFKWYREHANIARGKGKMAAGGLANSSSESGLVH